jgi:pilus assembly protein Flp/PilA
MRQLITQFCREEQGATMTEYGIMVALIAAVAIGVVATIGQDVLNAFQSVESEMPSGSN